MKYTIELHCTAELTAMVVVDKPTEEEATREALRIGRSEHDCDWDNVDIDKSSVSIGTVDPGEEG